VTVYVTAREGEPFEELYRNEAAVLTGDPRRLAVVNLEIELRNGGDVADYRCWGEWKGTIRRRG